MLKGILGPFGTFLIGASRPDGIPYGLTDSFFFVLPPHVRWPFVAKKTTDWAEILQNHT